MKTKALIFAFLMSSIMGYSQVLVSFNKSESVDFSEYKTYNFASLDVKNSSEFEPKKSGLQLLKSEIINQMNARGYKLVNESSDLIINIGITITSETQTRETNYRDAPRYMGQRNYQWATQEVVVRKFNEGTVTLDIVDSIKNELIWQAVYSEALSKKHEKNEKKIIKSVKKLFKKYPVKSQK